jgi:hypothetical protein
MSDDPLAPFVEAMADYDGLFGLHGDAGQRRAGARALLAAALAVDGPVRLIVGEQVGTGRPSGPRVIDSHTGWYLMDAVLPDEGGQWLPVYREVPATQETPNG